MERRRKPLRRQNSIRMCFGNRERREGGDEGLESVRREKAGAREDSERDIALPGEADDLEAERRLTAG